MKERASRRPAAYAPSWRLAIWAAFAAAAWLGLYCLHQHHVLGEEQLMLLLFLLVPIGAFLLSGAGQDRSEGAERE